MYQSTQHLHPIIYMRTSYFSENILSYNIFKIATIICL